MTKREGLYEAYHSNMTPGWKKPSILRQIKAIDEKNDKRVNDALDLLTTFEENGDWLNDETRPISMTQFYEIMEALK